MTCPYLKVTHLAVPGGVESCYSCRMGRPTDGPRYCSECPMNPEGDGSDDSCH